MHSIKLWIWMLTGFRRTLTRIISAATSWVSTASSRNCAIILRLAAQINFETCFVGFLFAGGATAVLFSLIAEVWERNSRCHHVNRALALGAGGGAGKSPLMVPADTHLVKPSRQTSSSRFSNPDCARLINSAWLIGPVRSSRVMKYHWASLTARSPMKARKSTQSPPVEFVLSFPSSGLETRGKRNISRISA